MKINELKVGDRIKFTQNGVTQEDVISSFHQTLIGISDGKLVHKKEVVSKLEPVFKEIPIQHPIQPIRTKFNMKVNKYSCKNLTNIDDLMRYDGYGGHIRPTVIGSETELEAVADNGQPIYMKLPYALDFGFKTMRVTIEELP